MTEITFDPSMYTLNGNILCSIDTETTGLDPKKHDIHEICIIPLNSRLEPMDSILPFSMNLRIERVENIDPEVFKLGGLDLAKNQSSAFDPYKAADMFEEWFNLLKLPFKKKICPLGQNWPFDARFIQEWLGGPENFNYYFDYHYRDTCVAAQYLNDRAVLHNEPVPFPKVNLQYLCSQLSVENLRPHTAFGDALATAECYRKMIQTGPYLC